MLFCVFEKEKIIMNIKPGAKFSQEEFRSPSAEFAVTYMWFWNSPVTREKIDRELCEYKKAGIRSLYIVPMPKDFSPEEIRTYLDPEYLSREFFELVEYTLRKCVEMGIKPWIYDEGGWPSGGACYNTVRQNPKAKMKLLAKREVSLMSDKRFIPEENFIALFHGKHRLPDDYIASRDCTLTAYYVEEKIERGCRVDYTNASVTDTFINNTYEKYKEFVGDLFGSEIPIFFTDEPGLLRKSLADNEFELFEKEYGYDLRDYVYVLEGAGELAVTEKEKQARIDHHLLLGKLFKENTFIRLADWCDKNGMYYSGHLDIDNRPFGGMVKGLFSMVDALRNFHVPGVDVIWEQIRYPYGERAPVDDETLGMGFFPRLAPSAARQRGHNVTITESLGIYGDGLTHDEIRFVINYQFVRGINAANFAPISFGSSRLASLTTRPNFRPEKPGFYNLRELNEYIERLSYLTRLGYAEGDTALYMPCRDYCSSPDDLDEASVSFKALGTMLEEKNIAFDIIDDIGILEAEESDGGLKLGDAVYRHIAVPECKYMPESVKKKIAPYISEGEPTYKFNSDKLRVMTRKLDTGRLWFIFNEGEPTVQEALDISGGKTVYRIDARTGDIYRDNDPVALIPCGDIAIYLVTDEEYEVSSGKVEALFEAKDFKPFASRRFVFDHTGIHSEYGDGNIDTDAAFSGEISYKGHYELDREPLPCEKYRIRLEGFSSSASVKLGGKVYPLGMTPMYTIAKGEDLARLGEIEITVANTALDELHAKRDIFESFPIAEQGVVYFKKLAEFEKRVPKLKFGKAYIERLI